ncbi:ATP-binding cassette domain-containing protein [Oceanobacillus sp. HCA-5259]|uniref:ATP-binding cassette domain-containing protein n=1 Tax=Oceanobacillus sp. HCA-5259 TaxID=3134661 RepID=UPI0030BE421F
MHYVAGNKSALKNKEWAVKAQGLVKKFGNHRAVDGVDLKVPTGTIYGVLGPNGAGKTTTIKMLATLLDIDAGSAEIFGYDAAKNAQIVRQLISVTGQYASVDESLTAMENLMIFARLLGLGRDESKKRAISLLEEFDLEEAAKRPLKTFSGGMRRRLDLAASLIVQPPLIFLDEPTTGLDPRTRNQMWKTIRRLVDGGSTVLLTTQYLEEADALADRIAVIDKGRVVAEGKVNELKELIGTTSLNMRVESRASIQNAREIVDRVLGASSTISPEGMNIIAPMTNANIVADLMVELRKANIQLTSISVQEPTLDEVFLSITGEESVSEADHDTKMEGMA